MPFFFVLLVSIKGTHHTCQESDCYSEWDPNQGSALDWQAKLGASAYPGWDIESDVTEDSGGGWETEHNEGADMTRPTAPDLICPDQTPEQDCIQRKSGRLWFWNIFFLFLSQTLCLNQALTAHPYCTYACVQLLQIMMLHVPFLWQEKQKLTVEQISRLGEVLSS